MKTGPLDKVLSNKLEKPGIESGKYERHKFGWRDQLKCANGSS